MSLRRWFSRHSALQLALARGIQPGGDLAEELRKLGPYTVKSAAEAEAICAALASLVGPDADVGGEPALHSLINLFQSVAGATCPAFGVLAEKGTKVLVRIADDAIQNPLRRSSSDVLFALRILAEYATPAGTAAVIRAARSHFEPGHYLWLVLLSTYSASHPHSARVYQKLSDPLPPGFLAVALLDAANAAQREGAGWRHPFDSSLGRSRLEEWLTDGNPDHFSYAVSSTAALPFLSDPNPLLALAFDHVSPNVQLEAARVAAKLGREAGVTHLAQACLDFNLADRAMRYLAELERTDAIPPEATDAGFRAKAEFADWLAHPCELGEPPDGLEIVDHRELSWPPDYEPRPFWLMRYRVKDATGLKADDVDVGLVGSVTFCLFSYELKQRPPEDCYAIHCYWEMRTKELITETKVEEGSSEYNRLTQHCPIGGLGEICIIAVAELSRKLKRRRRLFALARATRQGEPGWVVLDGAHSRWYSAGEMPAEVVWETTVLMVHVGRVLLGFTEEPDRRKFLRPPTPPKSPAQILAAYEALLAVAELTELTAPGSVYRASAPLAQFFDQYVDALIAVGRQTDMARVIERLRPHWDHNSGYASLGGAAFKTGHDDLAESLLLQLRHSYTDWCRSEEIGYLAEVWARRGRCNDAQGLLVDSLKQLLDQSRSATGSDRRLFEEWFQTRRATFQRLFPELGDDGLLRHGIPPTTLKKPAV